MISDYNEPISKVIAGAEDIGDPLDGLIKKAFNDPGAAFQPDVVDCLAALKKDDPAGFEALRAELKRAGCRVTALDDAVAKKSGGGRGPNQADVLIKLAEAAELFRAPDQTGFADLYINGHRETWPIRSRGFRRWLARQFFETTQGAPSSEALQSALNVIEAKALFDAPVRVVHVRVGELDGKFYLDLCNETWQAVEIDEQDWRVMDNPPVRFRRSAGMKALPIPVRGGSIKELGSFLNVKSTNDFVLVVAYLLAALRPHGPYPVLVLSGEQGSAKSTLCEILKALLDPNTAPLRALPREDRDLFIGAYHSHILAFDNVSRLSQWISDTLCRLSTGGSFAVRQLYTNLDEVLFDAERPIILNGIEDFITKPDLADRSIFLMLEPIPEERRRSEKELWATFEIVRPRILGVLLDAVRLGLVRLPDTQLEKLPRMADFALWATACEAAFWPGGTLETAYCGNREMAVEGVLESDLVAVALRTFIEMRVHWTGTATELLGALGAQVGELQTRSKEWPQSARALSDRLRRAATFLRKVGVEVDFKREGSARTRTIHISLAAENGGIQPSSPSAPCANAVKPNGSNDLTANLGRTVGNNADDSTGRRRRRAHFNRSRQPIKI